MVSLRLRTLRYLTLLHNITRWPVLQKVRGYTNNVLPLLVSVGFQVLFHSPSGVLFTFPSRYYFSIGHQVVFSLGRWSSLLPTGFLVSRGTLDLSLETFHFVYRAITFYGGIFQSSSTTIRLSYMLVRNPSASTGLGSFPFARRYLGNRFFFLFLRVLRCFSSPGVPFLTYVFSKEYLRVAQVGFPIRKSPDQSLFATPRSISVLIPSFIGSWCQGIRPTLLIT